MVWIPIKIDEIRFGGGTHVDFAIEYMQIPFQNLCEDRLCEWGLRV